MYRREEGLPKDKRKMLKIAKVGSRIGRLRIRKKRRGEREVKNLELGEMASLLYSYQYCRQY